MADIGFPTDGSIDLAAYSDAVEYNVSLRNNRAARSTTRMLPGSRWVAELTFAPYGLNTIANRGKLEAFLTSLRGGFNRLRVWHPNKPRPLGTLQTDTTAASSAAANALSVTINATTGLTLLAGDRIGLGGTVYMVMADVAASGGQMAVSIMPPLRAAVAAGDAVTVVRPTIALVPVEQSIAMPYVGRDLAGQISVSMVEP